MTDEPADAGPPIAFIDNPHAPQVFASELTGSHIHNGVITLTVTRNVLEVAGGACLTRRDRLGDVGGDFAGFLFGCVLQRRVAPYGEDRDE